MIWFTLRSHNQTKHSTHLQLRLWGGRVIAFYWEFKSRFCETSSTSQDFFAFFLSIKRWKISPIKSKSEVSNQNQFIAVIFSRKQPPVTFKHPTNENFFPPLTRKRVTSNLTLFLYRASRSSLCIQRSFFVMTWIANIFITVRHCGGRIS